MRRADRGNGLVVRPTPRPGPTQLAQPRQHAGQRAPGDPAQHGPPHPRRRRAGRADLPRPGQPGGAATPSRRSRAGAAGAAGMDTQEKGGIRPLGIPVIADRAQQQRVRNALEPEWEARLDPKQYGFRPGRGCHDAIEG